MLIKINFEDHGQDFLSWTIDTELEEVVDCQPFQSFVWMSVKVEQKVFEVGEKVVFTSPYLTEPLAINYPIESVEILDDDGNTNP